METHSTEYIKKDSVNSTIFPTSTLCACKDSTTIICSSCFLKIEDSHLLWK